MYRRNSFSPTEKEEEKDDEEAAEEQKEEEEEQVEERSNAADEKARAPSSLEFRANGSPPQRCSLPVRARARVSVLHCDCCK